jgi:hypothetical protein
VAPRTREKQDDIIALSLALRRPVRFSDLTNRWAKSRTYGTVIEMVAERYRRENCTASGTPLRPSDEDGEIAITHPRLPENAGQTHAGQPVLAMAPRPPACEVLAASYGGPVALLIRSVDGARVNYTVLQVREELEHAQADAFIRAHMPNGRTIARFGSREHALERAFELCPS